MSIKQALLRTQNRTGIFSKNTIAYAESQLLPDESVHAAVTANIFSRRNHFPGIVAITDRRIIAAFKMPGIRRHISCKINELTSLDEVETPLTYRINVATKKEHFSFSISPTIGKNLSFYLEPLKPNRSVSFDTDYLSMSSQLHRWLAESKEQGEVSDTDPLSVAVRLCDEMDISSP